MANVLDSIHEYLTPTLIAESAAQLGENENHTAKALGAWCAAILAGLAGLTDRSALERLHERLSQFPEEIMYNPGVLLTPGNLARNDPKDEAGHLLGQIFGPRIPALTNGVAAFSGAEALHVSFLLGVAGPLVLSLLAHRIRTASLTVSGLANLLQADQERILSALPSGLGTLLGMQQQAPSAETGPATATGAQWLWPLLLLFALGAGIFFVLKWWN